MPLEMLSLSPTAVLVLVHLVSAQHMDRVTGAHSMGSKADIARTIGKSQSSTHSALGALAEQGLITDGRSSVQLREDAPLLPALYDMIFIAEGAPRPPDVVDALWLHPVDLRVEDVVVPYADVDVPDEVTLALCGPTLEMARRVLLDEWRTLIAARPALHAVRTIYGHRSEHGDAGKVLDDLVRAAAWLSQSTERASFRGRERLTAHEWAVHDILLDQAVKTCLTFGAGGRPLIELYENLRTLRNGEPDEQDFRHWMHQNLSSTLV